MDRGRCAKTPTAIPLRGWKDILARVWGQIGRNRIGLTAAGVAFYGLLALFPAITAIIAIGGLVIDPSRIVEQLEKARGILPQAVIDIVAAQATALSSSPSGGLRLAAIIGFAFALYSASNGMASLVEGLNVACNEAEKRGFFLLKAVTLLLTVTLIGGILISLAATLGLPAILAFLPLGPAAKLTTVIVVFAALMALTILGLSVLYRFAPSRRSPKWRWVSPGAVAACLIWILASAGFAWYAANFGNYNESFGTLGGAIVLLMWFWISAWVILLGAELNSEVEAQTRCDTTTGPARPAGERRAVKADNLGEVSA